MQSYTYILIDFLTVIVCFIFSFDRRIKFNRHFGAFLKASTLVAIPFILWDVLFTHMGVWWFDTSYTLGLTIFGLPLEEWLFFSFAFHLRVYLRITVWINSLSSIGQLSLMELLCG